MDYKEIADLIKLVNRSKLIEFQLKHGDVEISMKTEKYNKSVVAPPVPPMSKPTYTSEPASQPIAFENQPPPVSSTAGQDAPDGDGNLIEIRSPMVGTFYRSPSPDKPPYVKVGDVIEEGSVVCIVEAMKLFNEIESEISGKIVKVITEDASPVEYDQVLFLVEP